MVPYFSYTLSCSTHGEAACQSLLPLLVAILLALGAIAKIHSLFPEPRFSSRVEPAGYFAM
jgi:hypothetical protein